MTSFKSATSRKMTYIMNIMNDEDFEIYCERAQILPKYYDLTAKLFNKMGTATVINSTTGDKYIAKALPHMLRVQAA